MSQANHDLLAQARQRFFEQGESPSELVPALILRSWQRSRLLQPDLELAQAVTPRQLRERHEQHAQLRRAAQPALESLADEMRGLGGMVILTDPDGLILDAAGDLAFLSRAERLALKPGSSWSEAGRGTNAIGTALAEGSAVAVFGAEHYLSDNRILSCAATPLTGPDGSLAGVLDVSGEAGRLPAESLALVRLAATLVEHRLLIDSAGALPRLHFHRQAALLGSHREAVLIVEQERIVGANEAALRLLGIARERLIGSGLDEWFDSLPARRSGDTLLPFYERAGLPLIGRWANLHSAAKPSTPATAPDALASLLGKASRVLNAGLGVLIHGETGVGKEVFARRLHAASRRAAGPFVAVNCAALPENLIESELFGYEEGAFSGARKRGMPGRVREAAGGVLFLDEIGDMPVALQARLLRVLQDKSVTPLGGGKTVQVDFDLVCATHRDLNELVAHGQFRADLLFRLREYEVILPPLRHRDDKAALLARLFDELGGSAAQLRLDEAAQGALLAHAWPGNVRELVSTLRTLIALAETGSTLGLDDLPAALRGPQAGSQVLAELTREAMDAALAASAGCVSSAARRLGIHRSTLYRHLARQAADQDG
ncbi:sigma-54-dependent Fis family transcriptional regulator [Chitinimonas taiwanensis]|uniref:Transcriptional regulator of acetoin/glycerol metabolism n=1 Tax=Chitinimonas taiwanensis DSM 18899 TaxID=1121279 RepID=A0A1K2HKG9_9NEIS|nr:sigma-54-dependent Fis family transcriptional regulator [Chitinimonas taiwanensis]SFZ77211.1 Transcriptional regulator of acetoin/glycerol metabolism [Chitinimonas taiwanensis DSM 18899]